MNTRYQYRELGPGDPDLSRNPDDAWIDLGADVERRQQQPWTIEDLNLLYLRTQTQVEAEAYTLSWWISLGDDWNFPEWKFLAINLFRAYRFPALDRSTHDIAVTIVERKINEAFEEAKNK